MVGKGQSQDDIYPFDIEASIESTCVCQPWHLRFQQRPASWLNTKRSKRGVGASLPL